MFDEKLGELLGNRDIISEEDFLRALIASVINGLGHPKITETEKIEPPVLGEEDIARDINTFIDALVSDVETVYSTEDPIEAGVDITARLMEEAAEDVGKVSSRVNEIEETYSLVVERKENPSRFSFADSFINDGNTNKEETTATVDTDGRLLTLPIIEKEKCNKRTSWIAETPNARRGKQYGLRETDNYDEGIHDSNPGALVDDEIGTYDEIEYVWHTPLKPGERPDLDEKVTKGKGRTFLNAWVFSGNTEPPPDGYLKTTLQIDYPEPTAASQISVTFHAIGGTLPIITDAAIKVGEKWEFLSLENARVEQGHYTIPLPGKSIDAFKATIIQNEAYDLSYSMKATTTIERWNDDGTLIEIRKIVMSDPEITHVDSPELSDPSVVDQMDTTDTERYAKEQKQYAEDYAVYTQKLEENKRLQEEYEKRLADYRKKKAYYDYVAAQYAAAMDDYESNMRKYEELWQVPRSSEPDSIGSTVVRRVKGGRGMA